MGTRKNHSSNKRFRKTRSKRGGSGKRKAESSETALMKAVKYEDFYKVRELLKHPGIDVNAKNNIGQTVLMKAVMEETENIKIIKMLLKHPGINVNATDYAGRTALLMSILLLDAAYDLQGVERMVKMLLEHPGIDVNATDNNGWDPLMMASSSGDTEVVRMLLEKGADVNAKNYDRTALDIANEEGHTEIVKLLKQHIVAQTIPRHLEIQEQRKKDRENLHMVMSAKGVHPYLERFTGYYLGGKRKTRKSKKSKRKSRRQAVHNT